MKISFFSGRQTFLAEWSRSYPHCQVLSRVLWTLRTFCHGLTCQPSGTFSVCGCGSRKRSCAVCRVPAPRIRVFLCRLYENKGEADFVESLVQLFRSISEMMSSVSDQTVRVKVGPWVPQPRPCAGRSQTRGSPPTQESRDYAPAKAGLPRRGFAMTVIVVPVVGFSLFSL